MPMRAMFLERAAEIVVEEGQKFTKCGKQGAVGQNDLLTILTSEDVW